MGLFGELPHGVEKVRPGHALYPHQSPNQFSKRPLKFIIELPPSPEISAYGRGSVRLRLDIKGFHHLLDSRLMVDC